MEPTIELADWMTNKFFTQVLENIEKCSVELHKFDLKSGSAKGQNFASAIYRCKLIYTPEDTKEIKQKSLILKTNVTDPELKDLLNEFNVFQKEIAVYKNIFKEGGILLNSFGDTTIFGPNLIVANENVIILEDLLLKGYRLVEEKTGLDLPHAKVVLGKLAKFHAMSAVLYTKKPELFKNHLIDAVPTEGPLNFFYRNSVAELVKALKAHPTEQNTKYIKQLENFGDNVIEREKQVLSRNDNDFNVLNHGDLWLNNMLWKYDELDSDLIDVILIDYQEGLFCSPGFDLNHFFYASCKLDVQLNDLDKLLEYYHAELVASLKTFKYPNSIPTLAEIQDELIKKKDHAFFVLASIVPVMIIENVEHAEAAHFISDSDESKLIRKEVYSNPKYLNILNNLLPHFERIGYLE